MPSERRSMRGNRSRSKSRGLRGARTRLRVCEAEDPAMALPPRSSSPGRQAIMAAMPQASWRTPLRGQRRAGARSSGVKTWAYRHLRLVVLASWALLLLGYYMSPGFLDSLSLSQYIQWNDENASGQSLEKTSAWEALLSFFFPTTCIPKENQVVKACNELRDLNQSACLGYKCCYSLGISNFSCFAPLKDKPTQMFRMFGLGVISMIILGCLPIYCCSFCRRSKWANHLRRKVNRVLKGLKKRRNKLKEDTEILGTMRENEDALGDEKEQETKALFSH